MSSLATLTGAWCAVYAYVAVYYGLLFARRRAEREYRAFSGLAACFAVYALGCAWTMDATETASGASGQWVQFLGITWSVGFYCEFVHEIGGLRRARFVRLAYAWSLFGFAANAAGLFFDPAVPGGGVRGQTLELREAELLPTGVVFTVGALLLLARAFFVLARTARLDSDARVIGFTSLLLLLAGAYDVLIHVLRIHSIYLMEHVGILAIVSASWVLLQRFARMSDALAARTAELHRSHDELGRAQQELLKREQLAMVGELSAVIAHEVRHPLSVIQNAVASLRAGAVSLADRGALLGILDEESDRLNRLVNDLLVYARPLAPQGKTNDVEDLVTKAADAARKSAPSGSSVEFDVQLEGPRTVHGDPALLRQTFVNVIENALQAMPLGGTLTVRSSSAALLGEPAVALSFRDTGEGMDTLVRSKARDPFFTTRPSGTGLGLAIVERLVRAHNGTVSIDSATGGGTTVTITLPAESVTPLPLLATR